MAIILKCPSCGHTWIYRGNSNRYVCCPKCRTVFSIKKHPGLEVR